MMRALRFAVFALFVMTVAACNKPATEDAPDSKADASLEDEGSLPGKVGTAKIGELCGGIAGIMCGEGAYCRMEPGQCKVPDMAGTCVEQRPFCTKEYMPVCGCDGKTYGNACEAGANGVNIEHAGPC